MNIMQRVKKSVIFAPVLLAFCLCGCYLVADERIGGDEALYDDPNLPGLWKITGAGEYFLILRHKNGDFSFNFFKDDFEGDSEVYFGKATRVSGHTFLNVQRALWSGDKPPVSGYIPVHYKASEKELMIELFTTEFFDKAIAGKKIPGVASAKSGTYSSTPTRLTGKGGEVAKFILAHLGEKEIFEKKRMLFEKVKISGILPK